MNLPSIEDVEKSDHEALTSYCRMFKLNTRGKDTYLRKRLKEFIEVKAKEEVEAEIQGDDRKSFEYAVLMLGLKKPKEALKALDKISKRNLYYWLLKAKCFVLLDKHEKALGCYDRDIAEGKESRDALVAKQHLLHNLSLNEKAMNINLRLPEGICNMLARVLILRDEGKTLEAIKTCNLIIKEGEFELVYNLKGLLLMSFDRYTEALECFENALAINEDFPEAWNNKGVCMFKLILMEEADKALQRAIELKNDYATAWSNRGIIAYLIGRLDDAVGHFEKALEHMQTSEAWNTLGLIHLKKNRLKEASRCFERAIELDNINADAWRNRGLVLERRKMHPEARKSYDRARTLQPEFANAKTSANVEAR